MTNLRMLIPAVRRRTTSAYRGIPLWLNPESELVDDLQLRKIQEVWNDATTNVPYYKKLVESGLAPQNISSLEQFCTEVPYLTRAILLKHREAFVRSDRPPDRVMQTGGSTGEPLQFGFWKGDDEAPLTDALTARAANGMKLESDRVFALWGHSHLLGSGWRGRKNHLIRKLYDYLTGCARANSYMLDKTSAFQHFDALVRFKPDIVLSYSAALDMLARHNMDKRDILARLGIKMIIATAENLPRHDSREVIETFFHAPLIMEYGGVDFGCVAYEKTGEHYRVFWWHHFVETGGQEEHSGGGNSPIVVTNLYKRYLPLIRYYTGDEIAGVEPGSTRSILRFAQISGRTNDAVQVGQSVVHSVGIFHCIHQEPTIINIQLILESNGPVLVLVGEPNSLVEARIRRRLRDLSPDLEHCKIKYRADVETTLAGKRRWIIDKRSH